MVVGPVSVVPGGVVVPEVVRVIVTDGMVGTVVSVDIGVVLTVQSEL